MWNVLRIGAAIIGAQKSGTTSLAYALGAHPRVSLATHKEAHLFDDSSVRANGLDQERLKNSFPVLAGESLLLDATPIYMYLPGCIEMLAEHNPEAKIVAVLRDPGDRVVSHYYHSRRNGVETKPLLLALLLEPLRLARDRDPLAPLSAHRWWSYRSRGKYSGQILRVLESFDELLLVRYEDLVSDPERVLEKVQEFLELPHVSLVQAFERLNYHGPNPPHKLVKWAVRVSLKSEIRWINSLLRGSTKVVGRDDLPHSS